MQRTLEQYKSYIINEKGFSKETVYKYMSNLRVMFNRMKINNLSQVDSSIINKRLIDDFWKDHVAGKNLTDQTRIGYLSSLKSYLKFLYDHQYIDNDVSQKIVMPKVRQRFIHGLSPTEQKKVLDYLASHLKTEADMRNAALIMFLWATACRISEALNVRCHPNSYVYCSDESIRSGDFHLSEGNVYVHIIGKGKRDRVIVVADEALAYLNLYLDNRKVKNEILFQNIRNHKNNKIKLNRNSAWRIVDKIFKECEIYKQAGVSTHVLRHTAINTWIEKGIDGNIIRAMTGHSAVTGLDPYFERNKRITDIFGDKAKSIPDIENKDTKDMHNLLLIKYSRKYLK